MSSFNNNAPHNALDETRLDKLDRTIVTELAHQPEASFSTIATKVGVSARTVARRFDILNRRGVIRIIGRTLPSFGGRLAWLWRIKGSPQTLDKLSTRLQQLETTRWLRYSLDRGELLCGSVTEGLDHKELFRGLYATVPTHDVHAYQLLSVWGNHGITSSALSYDELDDIDRSMLRAYGKDGRISAASLAQALGVNPATISRHRSKLVASGILFFETIIHPSFFNALGDYNLWLSVRPGKIRALGELIRSTPQARFVGATTGSSQLYANIVVHNPADILTYLDDLVTSAAAQALGINADCVTGVETIPMGQFVQLPTQ